MTATHFSLRGSRSVHDKSLPPMAGGSDDHKHEVICIEAKQICDFCFQEEHLERTFTGPTGGMTADCEIDTMGIVCREVSRREVDSGKEKFLICLAIEVPVTIRVFNGAGNLVETLNERVIFLKQAVLCAPAGTMVDCQVTGECCCFIHPTTGQVSCVFDFCVILQTAALVRVLVQTLGPCIPKECRASVVGCPPKLNVCKECDC